MLSLPRAQVSTVQQRTTVETQTGEIPLKRCWRSAEKSWEAAEPGLEDRLGERGWTAQRGLWAARTPFFENLLSWKLACTIHRVGSIHLPPLDRRLLILIWMGPCGQSGPWHLPAACVQVGRRNSACCFSGFYSGMCLLPPSSL